VTTIFQNSAAKVNNNLQTVNDFFSAKQGKKNPDFREGFFQSPIELCIFPLKILKKNRDLFAMSKFQSIFAAYLIKKEWP